MLFVSAPPRRKPLPAFAGSVALHCLLIVVMLLWPVIGPWNTVPVRKYPFRFVQLETPQYYRPRVSTGASRPGAAEVGQSAGLPSASRQRQAQAAGNSGTSEAFLPEQPIIPRKHRQFVLPPNVHVQPVKQTLVQLDLPPNLVLKQEIPLPTALLWQPSPMRRQFIAPPLKQVPKVTQALPVSPMLEPPNTELNIAQLNIARDVITDTPHLAQPPAIAPPVSSVGQEPAKEIRQTGLADSSQPSPANLVSLPTHPLRSATMLVLPPANQIAPSDVVNTGSSPGSGGGAARSDHGSGAQGQGLSASAKGGAGAAHEGTGGNRLGALLAGTGEAGSGSAGSGAATGLGAGRGTAASGNGSTSSGTGEAAGSLSGSGTTSGTGASAGPLGSNTAGLTRITLPKDGKFGVVVSGAAGSTPYPESVGALSGKVVYTVYVKVGLRKSWILQYCLPQAAQTVRKGTATSLDAPWPFLMLRLDRLSDFDPDYIMVHGMLTSAGQFDQLAMLFPAELEQRDLLLKSLKLWAFRPASRDGEPVAVEVLLIIPRQTE
jgi:hypothetical protein